MPSDRFTLDRLLSKLGIASRTTSEVWIRSGRVSVNHRQIKRPDTWVSWPSDTITIDGQPVAGIEKRFFILNKPKGLVTTHRDEKGRKTIFELFPQDLGFIHAVGRLDQATSGLLLITNDPALSSFLTDPQNQIIRVYLVTVRGLLTDETAKRALAGVMDQGEKLQCKEIRIRKSSRKETHLQLVLEEGKNREIRRMLKLLGHEVTRLKRLQYGPFLLEDLQPGEWREIPFPEAKQTIQLQIKNSGVTYATCVKENTVPNDRS